MDKIEMGLVFQSKTQKNKITTMIDGFEKK